MVFVVLIVAVALIFDYVNGWHDSANSIATVALTRVLSPGLAVLWAAFFNFVAFALFGTRMAKTPFLLTALAGLISFFIACRRIQMCSSN